MNSKASATSRRCRGGIPDVQMWTSWIHRCRSSGVTRSLTTPLIVCSILASGCSRHKPPSDPPAFDETLPFERVGTGIDIRALTNSQPWRSLVERVSRAQLDQLLADSRDTSAPINPNQRTASPIKTWMGLFLVSTEEVTPHLDGHKVRIDVVNTTSITAVNVDVKATWQQNTSRVDLTDSITQRIEKIEPGTFASCTLSLTPSTATQLRDAYLTLSVGAISYRGPKQSVINPP